MKNFAVLDVSSDSFLSELVHGRTVFRGLDEFASRVSESLRERFVEAGMACDVVRRSFKPAGYSFNVRGTCGRYCVTISIEATGSPHAELVVVADPRADSDRSWALFEPLFHRVIGLEFPGEQVGWMTADDFARSEPPA
jgi:hypothetical protein